MHAAPARATGFAGPRAIRPEDMLAVFDRARSRRLPVLPIERTTTSPDPPAADTPTFKNEPARAVERRLVQRATFGMTQDELAQVETLGYHQWLDQQLDPDTIDDFGLDDLLDDALPSIQQSPWEVLTTYAPDDNLTVPVFELIFATLYRAIYSPRQLYERMVVFWTDHFHVDILSDWGPFMKATDEREVIRPHALGTFPDLLRASAHSPAMLTYLTNDTNVAGHANENYAREIMELHTLGRDNGYTQADVRDVARCFTGWTFRQDFDEGWGRFYFDATRHDVESKTVLGHFIPAGGGQDDGERVLDILAMHPNTARWIATKLLRGFWGYEPAPNLIDALTQTYLDTGGDVRAMMRVVLRRLWVERATPKIKRPFHLAVSAIRALGGELQDPGFVLAALLNAGHLPYFWSPPNGYPDTEGYWSGYLLPRWDFATDLLRGAPSPLRYDAPFLFAPSLAPWQIVRRLSWLLTDATSSAASRSAISSFLNQAPHGPDRIRDAIGLALASPEFQSY